MKMIIVTLGAFFTMKLVYGFLGDYYSNYWSVVFYLFQYALLGSVFRYFYRGNVGVKRSFFGLAYLYFALLFLLHVICLVHIDLYTKLVSDVGYYGIGFVFFAFGISFIKIKSHVNKRVGPKIHVGHN